MTSEAVPSGRSIFSPSAGVPSAFLRAGTCVPHAIGSLPEGGMVKEEPPCTATVVPVGSPKRLAATCDDSADM